MKQFFTLFFSCIIVYALNSQTEPRLVLPVGHTDEINSVVYSPNGKLLLTASKDNTARIFEISSGKELRSLIGDTVEVYSAKFSPDGRFVLTTNGDGNVRYFDVLSGRQLKVFAGHNGSVKTANFNGNGDLIITAGEDKKVIVWSLTTGKAIQKFKKHKFNVVAANLSTDGKLAISTDEFSIKIWNVDNGKEITGELPFFSLDPSGGARLKSARFSSDNKYVIIQNIGVYETITGRPIMNESFSAMSIDGKLLVKRNGNAGVTVRDVFKDTLLFNLELIKGRPSEVLFSENSKVMMIHCSDSSYTQIIDLTKGKLIKEFNGQFGSAIISPDGAGICFVVNNRNGRLKFGRLYSEPVIYSFNLLNGTSGIIRSSSVALGDAEVSYNGDYSLVETWKEGVLLIENSTGRLVRRFNGSEARFNNDSKYYTIYDKGKTTIYDVDLNSVFDTVIGLPSTSYLLPNGNEFISFLDTEIVKQNAKDGRVSQSIHKSNWLPMSVKFLNENNEFIVATSWKNVYVISLDSLKLKEEYPRKVNIFHPRILCSEKSPNGELLMVVRRNGTICFYSTRSGKKVEKIKGGYGFTTGMFLPGGKEFITGGRDNAIRIWNQKKFRTLKTLKGHTDDILSIASIDDSTLVSTSSDQKVIFWNHSTGKALYTRLQLQDNDWLVYDEHYRFDGTPGAIEKLYFVCGLEPIELGQMKDALYVPGLAGKILNGEDINYKKLSELEICGALPIIEKTNESPNGWEFSIEQRRWPIVRLEVMVDGKIVKTIASDQLKFVNAKATLRLTPTDLQQHLKPGEENKVTVIAITENDNREFKSRGVQLKLKAVGEKQDPNLYMLMIGVNDYKDDALDLSFPVQDARAFGTALESSARKLLGNDKVFVYNVQSKTDNTAVYTTPERAGVMKALEDIGKKAKTNDVLFIFFAGHGVMQGADNTFTFLTADASKLNPVGISTTDLKSWLSPEGPFHMMPNKTVLVYDACNSGQAAKEIMADLAMARDDDATERQRQIEDLGDKQGVFILSASAPNQSAYELPHLGQGMLTYSLLTTLKNNPGVLDEDKNGKGFLNLQKWFLETEREQSRLMQSLGLNQDAQPYGTANIRIGLVDDEVRNGIALMAEKPLVYCSNARDDNDEDPLELKQAVNTYLETATTRGTSSKLGYIKAETSQANIVKLVYSVSGVEVQCRILIFKNKVKLNELNINTTSGKAAEDVVKAVEGGIK